jgi:hypothetical protein
VDWGAFNVQAKTLDPVWDGDDIVCTQLNVTIHPPYDEASIRSGNAKAKTRVATVLAGELRKMDRK